MALFFVLVFCGHLTWLLMIRFVFSYWTITSLWETIIILFLLFELILHFLKLIHQLLHYFAWFRILLDLFFHLIQLEESEEFGVTTRIISELKYFVIFNEIVNCIYHEIIANVFNLRLISLYKHNVNIFIDTLNSLAPALIALRIKLNNGCSPDSTL